MSKRSFSSDEMYGTRDRDLDRCISESLSALACDGVSHRGSRAYLRDLLSSDVDLDKEVGE